MESQSFNIHPQVPQQTDDIISIDHKLYKAAAMGQTSAFEEYKDRLHCLLTPGRNTVLHIYFKKRLSLAEIPYPLRLFNDSKPNLVNFAETILEMCPRLLMQQNHLGETLLHVAAKYGDLSAVKLLIGRCANSSVDRHNSESGSCGVSKQVLLRMKNNAGDTALHESILMWLKSRELRAYSKYLQVAKILSDEDIEVMYDRNAAVMWLEPREFRAHRKYLQVAKILSNQDIEVMYDRNAAGETPLYLAVKAGFKSVVKKGLRNMEAQTTSPYYGGSDGKTILHEAVISGFSDIDVILEGRKELCRVADYEKGWVPLHYAANLGKEHALKKLLEYDPFAACIKDKNGQIPLQVIADPKICRSFIKKIISKSPDCCELLRFDEEFYHDDHTTATLLDWFRIIGGEMIKDVKQHFKYSWYGFTGFEEETEHAFKIWKKTFNDCKKPDEEKFLDRESTLVVAALIATVTFAAGFTLPGGYVSGGDKLPSNGAPQLGAAGSAVLIENAAFKAFLLSDSIAMVLSSCAVFIHLFLALKKDGKKDSSYFLLAFNLIIVAMVVMVVAFMTGIYAVLGSSNAIAFASCVFISASFLLCIVTLTFGYFTNYAWPFLFICYVCLSLSYAVPVVVVFVIIALLILICYSCCKTWRKDKDSQLEDSTENTKQEGLDPPLKSADSRNLETLPGSNVNPMTPSTNEESVKSSEIANSSVAEKGDNAV